MPNILVQQRRNSTPPAISPAPVAAAAAAPSSAFIPVAGRKRSHEEALEAKCAQEEKDFLEEDGVNGVQEFSSPPSVRRKLNRVRDVTRFEPRISSSADAAAAAAGTPARSHSTPYLPPSDARPSSASLSHSSSHSSSGSAGRTKLAQLARQVEEQQPSTLVADRPMRLSSKRPWDEAMGSTLMQERDSEAQLDHMRQQPSSDDENDEENIPIGRFLQQPALAGASIFSIPRAPVARDSPPRRQPSFAALSMRDAPSHHHRSLEEASDDHRRQVEHRRGKKSKPFVRSATDPELRRQGQVRERERETERSCSVGLVHCKFLKLPNSSCVAVRCDRA